MVESEDEEQPRYNFLGWVSSKTLRKNGVFFDNLRVHVKINNVTGLMFCRDLEPQWSEQPNEVPNEVDLYVDSGLKLD